MRTSVSSANMPSVRHTMSFRYALMYSLLNGSLTFLVTIICCAYFLLADVAVIKKQIEKQYALILETTIVDDVNVKSVDDGEFLYLLIDSNKRKLAGNLDTWPSMRYVFGWYYFSLGLDAEKTYYLAKVERIDDRSTFVALSLTDWLPSLRLIIAVALISCIVFCLFSVTAAIFVAKHVQRRLHDINDSFRQIQQGDFSRRIPEYVGDPEIEVLIKTANGMLDKIQELVEGVRQVSNNIAHDLRTPLTRMRMKLVKLKDEVDISDVAPVERLISETDELLSTFNALLRIARLEAQGSNQVNFELVDLGQIMRDVIELYEPLAHDKGIFIDVEELKTARLFGDEDLLFQLFVNIVDNAIKYSNTDSEIKISVMQLGYHVVAEVSDEGEGIPVAERNKVFDRFYRVESSRSLKPGNGLGLSLVAAIIERHKGEIKLHDNKPGLLVEMIFNYSPK